MPNDRLIVKYADWESSAAIHLLLAAGWHGIIEFIDHPTSPDLSSAAQVPRLITEGREYAGYKEILLYAQDRELQRTENERLEYGEYLREAEILENER
jgi:hypothetical protein